MSEFRPLSVEVTIPEELDATHGLARVLRQLQREQELFDRFHAHKEDSIRTCAGTIFPRVQIGSGTHPLDGFTNLDLGVDADIIWDIREGLPFDDGSVEFIFSEHTLEHIDYPISVKRHFGDLNRVLATRGRAVIGVPDGRRVVEAYYDKDDEAIREYQKRWYKKRDCLADFNTPIDTVNYVFRDEDDSLVYTPHFWAYDLEKMRQLFTDAGFEPSSIRVWDFDPSIATPKREWGTLYVEAQKP